MIALTGILNENLELFLEAELFNDVNNYPTDIKIDTGMTGFDNDAFIGISEEILINLKLKKKKESVKVWNPFTKCPEDCHLTELGTRLKENGSTKFEYQAIAAVILPFLDKTEVLIGPEFLTGILGTKRVIIDYEKNVFRIIK